MRKKYLTTTALTLALAVGSTMASFTAGFASISQDMKHQQGSGDYCTNNWVNYKSHQFFFSSDQIMRIGWIQKDGTQCYVVDTGKLQGGIVKINGSVYYPDNNSLKLMAGTHSYNGESHELTEDRIAGGDPYIHIEQNNSGIIKRDTKSGAR